MASGLAKTAVQGRGSYSVSRTGLVKLMCGFNPSSHCEELKTEAVLMWVNKSGL